MTKEGINSQQFEDNLRSKFVQVKPDDSFIRNLSEQLHIRKRIYLEKNKKFLYYLTLILLGFFSGMLLWSFVKRIFFHSKDK